MTTEVPIWFYNLRVGRSIAQVRRELHAILNTNPAVLGLCEGVGYPLPRHDGYRLIRDRSTKSRANVAAYVKKDGLSKVRWHDMKQTWHRTEHPGVHEPRSWIEFRYFAIQVLVGHQPPKYTNNTIPAQQEGINLLVDRMAPWEHKDWRDRPPLSRELAQKRPRVVIMDANRRANEEGPGPMMLAQKIDGHSVGQDIDLGVVRGGRAVDIEYPRSVGGVDLKSDHEKAFRFKLVVDDRFVS